jgi:hypothetical protein
MRRKGTVGEIEPEDGRGSKYLDLAINEEEQR